MSDALGRPDGVRPILKWAGGKRQLLPALRPFYPSDFHRYLEPFLGSGAVFLDLWNLGLVRGRQALLSDVNADIIGCYRMVRDRVEEVIESLIALEAGHRERGRDHFYEVRDGRFNPARQGLTKEGGGYTPELAAMLIYLNRTGYNGLFRLNSRGSFNVPAGRYPSVRICDAANLRRLAAAFGAPGVALAVRSFDEALDGAGEGDFVYLDPPYAPLSATASFTAYTAGGFGQELQVRLQQRVLGLAERGARILLSNSVAPEVRDLYDTRLARQAGFRARTVAARRPINSRAAGRGAVQEYLISNVRPPARPAR